MAETYSDTVTTRAKIEEKLCSQLETSGKITPNDVIALLQAKYKELYRFLERMPGDESTKQEMSFIQTALGIPKGLRPPTKEQMADYFTNTALIREAVAQRAHDMIIINADPNHPVDSAAVEKTLSAEKRVANMYRTIAQQILGNKS